MAKPKTSLDTTSAAVTDLSNCDREPIHILGRVQSFGALVSVSSDWIINHASKNIVDFIGETAESLIGQPFSDCFETSSVHDIRTKLQLMSTQDAVERLFGVKLKAGDELFDVAIHLSGRSIVIELERHSKNKLIDYNTYVRPMVERIGKAETVTAVCDVAARQLRALTGFDRVMVYKFQEDDSGMVISESLKSGMQPFKGLRYPASDIPKQARLLYKRNMLRIICDVHDLGSEIIPDRNPEGEPLDLSLSGIRSVSPIHLEYLKNMGVGASMSISIIKRGKLWGLLACHHNKSKVLSYDVRSAAELFGQLFSFVLDQREGDQEREEIARARVLHDQLMMQLAEDSSVSSNFESIISTVQGAIPHDGAVGWIDGQFMSQGHTPTREEFLGLVRFLNTTASGQIYAQSKLYSVYPSAEDFQKRAAGLLVLPVSRSPRDYIVLFRREIAQSITWAGNPDKPVELGPHGVRLTPRKSFEAWKQIVSGECQPWSQMEVSAAESLRITLLEVVLRIADSANKEQARSQERQEILIAELNHRVRNILNLIRSLISQTSSEGQTTSEFTKTIGGRIHALARAHDQITKENWSPASVYELISTETDAYLGPKSDRVIISGPDPFLVPTAFTTLSLVIHELVTNSAKYGALCDQSGRVDIKVSEEEDGSMLLRWREIGGPPIKLPPTRRGFGSTIIERSIPYELQGEAEIDYVFTGLEAKFKIPPSFIHHFGQASANDSGGEPLEDDVSLVLTGEALLVEDNIIIAMDAEDSLTELGANAVNVAANVADALAILKRESISVALLDVNLGAETSEPIAEALQKKNIPFAFATGYGDTSALKDVFPDVPIVQKPYDTASIAHAFSKLNCL